MAYISTWLTAAFIFFGIAFASFLYLPSPVYWGVREGFQLIIGFVSGAFGFVASVKWVRSMD